MKRAVCLAFLIPLLVSTGSAQEKVDRDVVHRIKHEAFQNSRVMDHLFYLTDVNGPRLTASPGFAAAARWSIATLSSWGITGARTEGWGAFGRGWEVKRFAAWLQEPAYARLDGVPKAWTGGTGGPRVAEVILAPLFTADEREREDEDDIPTLKARIERYRTEWTGRLKGRIVLIDPVPDTPETAATPSERLDAAGLESIGRAPDPAILPAFVYPQPALPESARERERFWETVPDEIGEEYYVRVVETRDALNAFLRDEGVVAVFGSESKPNSGIVRATSGGSWKSGSPVPPPIVALPHEQYSRLVRLAGKKIPARIGLDIEVKLDEGPIEGTNVLAEIPGGRRKEEIVMLGAHLDSWHGGTGATDNASGCAIALEAMRILKTLGLKLDRTVRLALWGGEEQGLFGSRGYVRRHFGDPVTMALGPEHARLSGYFNVDNGSGKIRGVYLQGNDMVRPIFEAWLAPFNDLGATTLGIADTRDTDHVSFDAVGLPGFQFIQDPLDYETRTHHTDMDLYDHVQPRDLMQASAILASFVYDAATRPDPLPRKPLPPPLTRASGR